jgi:signal transduction histidine kinase
VLDEICNTQRLKIEEKGLELFLITDPDVPHYVVGDSSRLEQIRKNALPRV